MTRDEVIRLAREAGANAEHLENLERFAALVAAHERAACAKVADYYDDVIISNAIRARGNV